LKLQNEFLNGVISMPKSKKRENLVIKKYLITAVAMDYEFRSDFSLFLDMAHSIEVKINEQ